MRALALAALLGGCWSSSTPAPPPAPHRAGSAGAAPAGTHLITTLVVDAATDRPIDGALVIVLRPGIRAQDADPSKLDEQSLTWGRSNAKGEVRLRAPVPNGAYSVLVSARGFEPLAGDDALRLRPEDPPGYDPWGKISLRARP